MTAAGCTIRPAADSDRSQWEPLWRDYVTFYKSEVSDRITDLLWQRIHDCQHPTGCFVAHDASGDLVGFVHYFPHPDTWHDEPVCYLQDLFVSPEVRGQGVGEALIGVVVEEGRIRNWHHVYWHTQEGNRTARGLYDKVTGGANGFICYQIELKQ